MLENFGKGFLSGMGCGFAATIILTIQFPNLAIVALIFWVSLPVILLTKNLTDKIFSTKYSKIKFWFLIITVNYLVLLISLILFSHVGTNSELSDLWNYVVNRQGKFIDILVTTLVGSRKINVSKFVVALLVFISLLSVLNYTLLIKRNDINYKITKDIVGFVLTCTTTIFTLTSLAQLTINKNYLVTDTLIQVQGGVLSIIMCLFPVLGATCVLVNRQK